MFEVALTSAATVVLVVGLVAVTIVAGCFKFQHKAATVPPPQMMDPSNDENRQFSGMYVSPNMGNMNSSPVSPMSSGITPPPGMMGMSPMSPVQQAGIPGRTPVMSVVNNREAPDLVNNKKGFNPQSVNFANISDFRGDAIKESAKIQNDRANSTAVSGMLTPSPMGSGQKFSESGESSEEYDEESGSDFSTQDGDEPLKPTSAAVIAPIPPVPAARVTVKNIPNPTVDPKTGNIRNNDFEHDLEAGIHVNPAIKAMRGGTGGENGAEILKSLNFTKETVAQSFAQQTAEMEAMEEHEGHEGHKGVKRRVKKKKRTKKKVRSVNLNKDGDEMGEVQRVPGSGKKRRKKPHEDI